MKDEFNILFPSSGKRVALIELFRKAMRELGLKGKIICCDHNDLTPSLFIADKKYSVSNIDAPDYIDQVLAICAKEKVKLLIPTIDTDLCLFSENIDRFQKVGSNIFVSDHDLIRRLQDKFLMHEILTESNIPTCSVVFIEDVLSGEKSSFPYLMKPRWGHSSIDVHKICDLEELIFYSKRIKNPLLAKHLEGIEYTLDILVDDNKALSVIPRHRIEIRGGEIYKGKTVKNDCLINAGQELCARLKGLKGVINAQCFLNDNKVTFFEINPRFGGGYPLSQKAGVNFPKCLIKMALGTAIDPKDLEWNDGIYMMRYDEAVYMKEGKLIEEK
jgi:carbamoyl-phosphate synthase large subunit